MRVYPTSFTPTESNFKGVRIEGVRFEIVNRELLDSTRLGLEVAAAIQKLYPGKIDFVGLQAAHRQRRSYPPASRQATIRAPFNRGMQDSVAAFLGDSREISAVTSEDAVSGHDVPKLIFAY